MSTTVQSVILHMYDIGMACSSQPKEGEGLGHTIPKMIGHDSTVYHTE